MLFFDNLCHFWDLGGGQIPLSPPCGAATALFQYQNGRFLTGNNFTPEVLNLLEKGSIKSDDYADHIFRIGAAGTAAAKKDSSLDDKIHGSLVFMLL